MAAYTYRFGIRQREKIADYCVNIAVAWFVASLVTPFFLSVEELALKEFILRIAEGVIFSFAFLYISLIVVSERR